MLAVPKNDISHVADAKSVYQHFAGVDLVHYLGLLAVKLQHVAGLQHEHVLLGDAKRQGQAGVGFPVAELAVDGDGVLRFHKGVDQLQLLLTGMSGYVGILEDHVGPLLGELIDDLGDGFLISRNGIGAEDNRVSGHDSHFLVDVRRHPGQGRHGLSLASCGDEHCLLRRIVLQLVDLDQGLVGHIQVAQLLSCGDDVHHAPALHNHLPVILVGRVDDLLHAVHVGREGGDDDPCVLVLREEVVKGVSHRPL